MKSFGIVWWKFENYRKVNGFWWQNNKGAYLCTAAAAAFVYLQFYWQQQLYTKITKTPNSVSVSLPLSIRNMKFKSKCKSSPSADVQTATTTCKGNEITRTRVLERKKKHRRLSKTTSKCAVYCYDTHNLLLPSLPFPWRLKRWRLGIKPHE